MNAKREPVAIVAVIVTAVKATLAALILLHVVKLSGEQVAGIAVAVETGLAVPAALFVRSRVSPVPKKPKPLDPKLVAAIRLALEELKDDYVAATAPAVARLVELRQAEVRSAQKPSTDS